jgi:hypothetical protein
MSVPSWQFFFNIFLTIEILWINLNDQRIKSDIILFLHFDKGMPPLFINIPTITFVDKVWYIRKPPGVNTKCYDKHRRYKTEGNVLNQADLLNLANKISLPDMHLEVINLPCYITFQKKKHIYKDAFIYYDGIENKIKLY